MNIEHIDIAIKVMERVRDEGRNLNMCIWQEEVFNGKAIETESKLHECGTAACFAGWLAVSPEFQEKGGSVDPSDGGPCYDLGYGSAAVEKFLGISEELAEDLCAVNLSESELYECDTEEITVNDVIEALNRIKSGEFE